MGRYHLIVDFFFIRCAVRRMLTDEVTVSTPMLLVDVEGDTKLDVGETSPTPAGALDGNV